MKRAYSYLISTAIHLALLLIALLVSFDVPAESITLDYGNVEFTTASENKLDKQKNKKKAKEDLKIRNSGTGEPLTRKEEENLPPVNKSDVENYVNGKFSIDFAGKRTRAIYFYTLPDYPAGVEKEVDIVLKIIIEPDGTISRIFPLIKADSRLEIAAINALKNWRFEPLPKGMPQAQQEAVVVFPYKLH